MAMENIHCHVYAAESRLPSVRGGSGRTFCAPPPFLPPFITPRIYPQRPPQHRRHHQPPNKTTQPNMPPPPPRRLLRLLPRRTKPPVLPPPTPSPPTSTRPAAQPTSTEASPDPPPPTQLYDRLAAAVLENDGLRRQISAHAAHLESLSLSPLPPPPPNPPATVVSDSSASHSRLGLTHTHGGGSVGGVGEGMGDAEADDMSPVSTAARAVSAPLPTPPVAVLTPPKMGGEALGEGEGEGEVKEEGVKPVPVVAGGRAVGSLEAGSGPPEVAGVGDVEGAEVASEVGEEVAGDVGGGEGERVGGEGEGEGSVEQGGSPRLRERRPSAAVEAGARVAAVGRKNSVRSVGRVGARDSGAEVGRGGRKRSKRGLRSDEYSVGDAASVRSRSMRSLGREEVGGGDGVRGLDYVSEREWGADGGGLRVGRNVDGGREEFDELGDVGPAVEVQEVEARGAMDMDVDEEKDMAPEIWELQVIVEALRGENHRLSMRVEELTRRADTARKRTGEMWGRVERERRGLERAILDVKNENVRLRADIGKLKGREDRVGEMLKGVKKWVEEGLVEFGEVQSAEGRGRPPRDWDSEGGYAGVGGGIGVGVGVGVGVGPGDAELIRIKQKNRELMRENKILRARAAHLQEENRRMYQDRRVDTDEVIDGIMERVPEREADMMAERSHTSDGVDAQGSCVVTFDW